MVQHLLKVPFYMLNNFCILEQMVINDKFAVRSKNNKRCSSKNPFGSFSLPPMATICFVCWKHMSKYLRKSVMVDEKWSKESKAHCITNFKLQFDVNIFSSCFWKNEWQCTMGWLTMNHSKKLSGLKNDRHNVYIKTFHMYETKIVLHDVRCWQKWFWRVIKSWHFWKHPGISHFSLHV